MLQNHRPNRLSYTCTVHVKNDLQPACSTHLEIKRKKQEKMGIKIREKEKISYFFSGLIDHQSGSASESNSIFRIKIEIAGLRTTINQPCRPLATRNCCKIIAITRLATTENEITFWWLRLGGLVSPLRCRRANLILLRQRKIIKIKTAIDFQRLLSIFNDRAMRYNLPIRSSRARYRRSLFFCLLARKK
jgi:hypothetical protein